MIKFKRNPKIHERYTLLSAPVVKDVDDSAVASGEEYATFLKSLSNPTEGDTNASNQNGLTRVQPSNTLGEAEKTKPETKSQKSVGGLASILQLKTKNDEIHSKQLKVIEDHMWQHKQEERELKRIEGDIVKKQRQLTNTMQEYENAVYKKHREEEIQALKAKSDLERIKQEAAVEDDKLTKSRIDRNISSIQRSKERERKAQTVTNSLEFQYERVADEIKRKRLEVENMTREFEAKIKMKEDEEYKLRKELAEMAISINMESQKHRTLRQDEERERSLSSRAVLLEKRKRNEEYNGKINAGTSKAAVIEVNKQRLDKDLGNTLNHITLKIREEGRKLTDVKSRLQRNSHLQRGAQADALFASYNRQALDSDEKIKLVDARKAAIQNAVTRERRERGAKILEDWKNRYLERTNEVKLKEVEDNVKHLSKFVSKQEDIEQSLYNQIKNCESERRRQEQTVEGIKQELGAVKKENAKLIKETALRCHKREEELAQRLLREEASLKKSLSEREERIRMFVKQRGFYQEEKVMLEREQKIHERLNRVGQKTDLIEQEMYA